MKVQSNWQVFRWPLLLGLVSVIGLLSALVDDGWYDALSWGALGAIVLLMLACWQGWRAS